MKKFILIAGLMTAAVMATDFTQLSTEELVALRGTVAADEVAAYQAELQDRLSSLTQEERQALMSKKGDTTAARTQTRTRSRAMDALNGDVGTGGGMGQGAAGGHGGGNGGGHGGPR